MIILLADDEQVNHRILYSCIKKVIPGAKFFFAKDGEEAINLAEREQPDVIFLDDKMPYPQGCWACSEIRKNERGRPEGTRAFIVTYSSTYVDEAYPEDDRRRYFYPEADSFHPKTVDQKKLETLLHEDYPAWKKQTLTTTATEPTTPAAGAGGGGTGEAVPPLVPHDALTTAITGELGRLAMSPPSKPLTLAHTAFSSRLSDERLRRSPAPTEAPSLRRSPSLATAGQSSFWKKGDERSLSPSVRRAPRLLDAPTVRLPRSAASSPMLFDKKTLTAAPTGAPAPTAPESTPLGGARVARV